MRQDLSLGRLAVPMLLAAGFLAGSIFTLRYEYRSLAAGKSDAPVPEAAGTATGGLVAGFGPVVKSAMPAVVSISSTRTVKVDGRDDLPFLNDPFFRQFFGGREMPSNGPNELREHGLGSGVILDSNGTLITNNHVIDGATDIRVTLADNRELKARLIGTDPKTDIAVLKVDASNLPVLPVADSSQAQVGDLVLAIGNPFGVGKTVTMGIISATGRGNLGIEDYEDFIQTDAAINPGNSGGALINLRGELIGINTAILAKGSSGNQGVGFAVPSNLAKSIVGQLLKNGKVERGYLGVLVQELTPEMAKAFGLDGVHGALVGDVNSDGPAAGAGLRKGDIITEIDGQTVTDSRSLRLRISQMAPGTTVKLRLFDNGSYRDVSVRLAELPDDKTIARSQEAPENAINGLSVENLTPQLARQLKLPADAKGVLVTDIDRNSIAAEAGLQPGDVIQSVNRQNISSVADFRRIAAAAHGQPLLLLVNREGRTSFIVLDPK
ncbi:MAG: DegQ family serine endoprotease [Blastocatellales bacterium]